MLSWEKGILGVPTPDDLRVPSEVRATLIEGDVCLGQERKTGGLNRMQKSSLSLRFGMKEIGSRR